MSSYFSNKADHLKCFDGCFQDLFNSARCILVHLPSRFSYKSFVRDWMGHSYISTFPVFAGPSGIRAGCDIENNGRFEAERPPALAGPPLDGRAATSVPFV